MKIIALSDTHSLHDRIKVPNGDVLVHAGDFCNSGSWDDLVRFNDWLGTLPHKHKLVTAGNHDRCVQYDLEHARSLLSNATLLIDEEITIDGVRFYMSPWSPTFGYWAWMAHRGEDIAAKWAKIPLGVDVLVTHGPAYGILDFIPDQNRHVGCEELLKRVMVVRPKVHIAAHIHEGYGKKTINYTKFYNVASCDGNYNPVNKPKVINI